MNTLTTGEGRMNVANYRVKSSASVNKKKIVAHSYLVNFIGRFKRCNSENESPDCAVWRAEEGGVRQSD